MLENANFSEKGIKNARLATLSISRHSRSALAAAGLQRQRGQMLGLSSQQKCQSRPSQKQHKILRVNKKYIDSDSF